MSPASSPHTNFGRADRVDNDDVARYDRLGDEWWDPKGAMAPLHKLNPTRIRYLRDLMIRHFAVAPSAVLPLAGLSVLDIGCGGGLLSEPLARLGGRVTGIDPAPGNVETALRHAGESGVSVDYRRTTAETLVEAGEIFDVVLALEVVEHVPNPEAFIATACSLVRPGGLFVLSTLNRTAKSFIAGHRRSRIRAALAAARHAPLEPVPDPRRGHGADPNVRPEGHRQVRHGI